MVPIKQHLSMYLRISESLAKLPQDTECKLSRVFKNFSLMKTRRLLPLVVQLVMLMLFTELMLLSLWEVDAPLPRRSPTWF